MPVLSQFRFHAPLIMVIPIAILLLAVIPCTSFAQGPQGAGFVPTPDEALMRDASAYASKMGVGLSEAVRRLSFQEDIGRLNAELTEKEESTFGGLWIQHEPAYHVIAQFTRDGEATLRPYVQDGPLAELIEVHQVPATLRELKQARAQAAEIADRLGIPHWSSISVSQNRAKLYVVEKERLADSMRQWGLEFPEWVEVVQVSEMPKPVSDIYGGLRVEDSIGLDCTSGFAASDIGSYGPRYGIVTAGHCGAVEEVPGPVYREETALPWVRGNPGGADDSAWHTAAGFSVRNFIRDDDPEIAVRTVTGKMPRSSQIEGDVVYNMALQPATRGVRSRRPTWMDRISLSITITSSVATVAGPGLWGTSPMEPPYRSRP